MNIYWFNWPSKIGGADTKFVHLLDLLKDDFKIVVVPNTSSHADPEWTGWLEERGITHCLRENLPARMDGIGISLCNTAFFKEGMAGEMKGRGLRIIWSNEMMWHFQGEQQAVAEGLVDKVLYTSHAQRISLEPGYRKALNLPPVEELSPSQEDGLLGTLSWQVTGNYINPEDFPKTPPRDPAAPFTIGRLSRPDPDKFPDDFPTSYERLGLKPPVRFSVMAWNDKLTERWSHHEFDNRWQLHAPSALPTAQFLQNLDLLVYDTSQRFQESWGRAVVEAMLTGVVPILPKGNGHHLENLIEHGVSGYLCETRTEFGAFARRLQADTALRETMSDAARLRALQLCDPEHHKQLWLRALT